MADSVLQFYDGLANDYHLLFQDWRQMVDKQAELLDRLLRGPAGERGSVLDCTCGIGTQAIGLALLGYRVHGTDLCARAIERAGREARALGATVTFAVADVRDLAGQVEGSFDGVLSCDNALPHLLTDDELRRAVSGMAARLRPGGLLLASIRDYDRFAVERPQFNNPRVFDDPSGRRIVFQVWDWKQDGSGYVVHQFLVRWAGGTWQTAHHVTHFRALRRAELETALLAAGFGEIRWHMPEESGYYQPIVTARRP